VIVDLFMVDDGWQLSLAELLSINTSNLNFLSSKRGLVKGHVRRMMQQAKRGHKRFSLV
jgi:hypothetical protein